MAMCVNLIATPLPNAAICGGATADYTVNDATSQFRHRHDFTCSPPVTTARSPGRHQYSRQPFRNTVAAAQGGQSARQLIQQVQKRRDEPWAIGFQTNERYIKWEENAGVELVKLYVAQKTGKDMDWVNAKLRELVTLVPDIVAKLGRVKADLILSLVSNIEAIAVRLVELEGIMPGVDLSRLSAKYPALLLEHDVEHIRSQLSRLREVLPADVRAEKVVEAEPVLLDVDISAVMAEIRRLLPKQDPVQVLLRNPSIVLDMAAFKMGSSLQDEQKLYPTG